MKKLSIFLLAILLTVSLFVSCDNSTKAVTDEHVTVKLSVDSGSRALGYTIETIEDSNLQWYYTAEKSNQNDPFRYGEASDQEVTLNTQNITLSQGLWDFILYAKRKDTNAVVYYGTSEGVLISKANGDTFTLRISVSPYTEATGTIAFDEIKISLNDPSATEVVYANKAEIYSSSGSFLYSINLTNGSNSKDVPSGAYTVVAKYFNEYGNVENASEQIHIYVWGGRTTKVSGTVVEETITGTIDKYITEDTVNLTVNNTTAPVFTANVAPFNSENSAGKITTVAFEANKLVSSSAETDVSLKISVKNLASAGNTFTVGNNESATAGISLNLTVAGEEKTGNFGYAVITTYIAKGLTGVKVAYNGTNGDSPIATDENVEEKNVAKELSSDEGNELGYNPASGLLRFKTNHFSEYYVVSDSVVALNETTNTAYASLSDAFGKVLNNETLVILKDCETGSGFSDVTPLRFTASGVTLDLNNKKITVNKNFSFLINGDNAVVKNGSIESARNETRKTKINSYVLVVNNCSNVILENLTLTGGLSLGGDTESTPQPGPAINAIVRNCNITSGDYYAVCSQQNSTAIIESGEFKIHETHVENQGVLQANFIGSDGPAGNIVVRGGSFTGIIKADNADYLTIEGGTFSVNPTNFLGDGYVVGYRNNNNYYEIVPPLESSENENVLIVNPDNAQYVLDGAFGSIDDKTIHFSSGTYNEKLVLGRPTKYVGSNTEILSSRNYKRTISNVTFTSSEGVELPGFETNAGAHVYGQPENPIYDYVLDSGSWCYDTNTSYYTQCKLSDFTFDRLIIVGNSNIHTSSLYTEIDGFKFINCSFTTGSTEKKLPQNQAIRYYNENNNGKVKNITVERCSFNNCYQGVYTQNINGITVTNSTFETTGHNAIGIQGNEVNHGNVVITGNTFSLIGDRIIRFGIVGDGTNITITGNTATNSGRNIKDETTQAIIKVEMITAGSLPEGFESFNISGNEWNNEKSSLGLFDSASSSTN